MLNEIIAIYAITDDLLNLGFLQYPFCCPSCSEKYSWH